MIATVHPIREQQMPDPWPMTVSAYHALGEMGLIPEKTELLYGFVYPKMPKSPLHRLLLLRLLQLLGHVVPTGFHVQPEQPIQCADSELEPDLSVIKGNIEDYARAHPTTAELVVEICVTSHEYDRKKLKAYALAGVTECWLVLVPEKQVEVYRRPNGASYLEQATVLDGSPLTCAALPQITLDSHLLFS